MGYGRRTLLTVCRLSPSLMTAVLRRLHRSILLDPCCSTTPNRWAASVGRSSVSLAAASKPAQGIFKYPLGAAEPQAIYDHPELYETAFSYRDIDKEVKFLRLLYEKHADGAPLTTVLELGCGPALHSIALARAKVPSVTGLDINAEMLKYARWRYEQEGGASSSKPSKGFQAPAKPPGGLRLEQEDMASFEIKDIVGKCDMAMCLLGTFSHMLDNDQAVSCLRCVAAQLRPGGLLVLELAHPGDLFDGTFIIGDGGKEVWEVSVGDTHKILVEWGAEFDNFDPVTQVLHRSVSFNVLKGEQVELALEEVIPQRQFTVQEIRLLASMTGLRLLQLYGDTDLDVDLQHEEAYRLIAVLSKP